MKLTLRLFLLGVALVALAGTGGGLVTVLAYHYVAPSLPDVATLKDIKLQVPLRIYTRDGRLMAEFGEMRRIPVTYDELPQRVIQAFIAAEDDRFFEHPGVDYQGLIRAGLSMFLNRNRSQGGGTITMQVVRNFLLTREKTIVRKVREIFLALKIEREMSKEDILALYVNKIFLGQRAYGIGAAAEVYYGKTLAELTLAETATIAGLPKAPSSDNPVSSPQRARDRRAYVLRRMRELEFITPEAYEEANAAPAETHLHAATVQVNAPYVAEMVRSEMLERVGKEAYTDGYRVITSLDSRLQQAAVNGLRKGLLDYDRRHGYRGPLDTLELPLPTDLAALNGRLDQYPMAGNLLPALVTEVQDDVASVRIRGGEITTLALADVDWARIAVDERTLGEAPTAVADVLAPGQIVYLEARPDSGWLLAQNPAVQGAIVAVDPMDGALVALTGGFDFYLSKFNRAVQARRQPGSSFKPFIYSAALEYGLTPASLINDAPVVFEDSALEDTWRPENYSKRFHGPTRLREALVRSRNLVSIRILDEIGIRFAVDHLQRFGFDAGRLPRNLSLALGSAAMSPVEMGSAYAILANGGYAATPYFIDRIEDSSGNLLFVADPAIVCRDCVQEAESDQTVPPQGESGYPRFVAGGLRPEAIEPEPDPCAAAPGQLFSDVRVASQVVDPQNIYLVADMMRDVVARGTGAKAKALGRNDLSGKTGTTNDHRDAWFSGFNAALVATAWVGFDQERPLGAGEAGGTAALPAWMYFMEVALAGMPDQVLAPPPGLVTVRISPQSGLLARASDDRAIFETFRVGNVPSSDVSENDPYSPLGELTTSEEEEPIF